MEQERFDPEFQELYNRYIREEEERAAEAYREISHELTLPRQQSRRWWYPAAAAAILVLAAGTWAVTSESGPFHPKPRYSKAEIRESLENTIHALSTCSKTVKEEFSRIGDLSAMSQAIKPAKKSMTPNVRNESNTTKN